MSNQHDGENWPYHENKNTGEMTACASNPCKIHGGSDIMASSLAEAYKTKYDETRQENSELKKQLGMDDSGNSIDISESEELMDNLLNNALDKGMRNNHVDTSNLHEGQSVIMLPDGSYISSEDAEKDFSTDDFNRLVISGNEYFSDEELAQHWNDSVWLDSKASESLYRRGNDKDTSITRGISVMRMPSQDEWHKQHPTMDINEYPAMTAHEEGHITDYYKRGAAVMDARNASIYSDMSQEAAELYPNDDGTSESHDAHIKANMMAWSDIGSKALLEHNPSAIWEHVDDDGIDHMAMMHGDNEIVRQNAIRSIQSDMDDNLPYYMETDDGSDGFIVKDGNESINVHIDTIKDKGTKVYWDIPSDNGSGSASFISNGDDSNREHLYSRMRPSLSASFTLLRNT